ncbi:MAG: hypothetical protein QHI38_09005 [Armatimonadota bacterium]|nr:hypothetical protein [Armatimonadota bacterium]
MASVWLLSSIVFITAFALCYKIAAKAGCELRAVNLWMNSAATAVLLAAFIASGCRFNWRAAELGIVSGCFAYLSTLAFFYHMRSARLAVSWTVIGLAVVFPVGASILIWGEQPTVKQWVGLAVLPIALVLLGLGRGNNER